MLENEKTTCMSSITLLILKEVRIECRMPCAFMAEKVGKSPSSWRQIENGTAGFSMDLLFQASKALRILLSDIISAAEQYANFLLLDKKRLIWDGVLPTKWVIWDGVLPIKEDSLLKDSQLYYESPRFKQRMLSLSMSENIEFNILKGPITSWHGGHEQVQVVDVFKFLVDKEFRETSLAPLAI